MNLDELRAVQSKERGTDSLQHLRESFYADAAAYIEDLEAERDRRAADADDPFADPEVRRLTDEVETAREVVEAIYERRLGKLVKRASLAAADMPADDEGLTAEERALFEDLVDRIEANKTHVLEILYGEADPVAGPGGDPDATASAGGDPGETAAGSAERTAGVDAAADDVAESNRPDVEAGTATDPGPDGNEHGSVPDDRPAGEARDVAEVAGEPGPGGDDPDEEDGDDPTAETDGLGERTTVRITGDVGEFFGVDERTYDLEPETVVTLPSENAEPLLEAGDAERVD